MEMCGATVSLGQLLKRSVEKPKSGKPDPNWRVHKQNFVKKSGSHVCEPGAVTFSAGWFGQGHAVSLRFKFVAIKFM